MPFKKNVELGPALKLSSWRKIALGTWKTAGDPSVYGVLEIDVEPALAYMAKVQAKSGERITLTTFTGKVMAQAIARQPQINCVLRFGRLYPRKSVDIFYQVASDKKGEDLSGMTVRAADTKSLPEIAREIQERVLAIREKGDPAFKKMKGTMKNIPGFLMHTLLNVTGWFMYTLNLWSPMLGSPRDPFGSCMITNIGSLGLDMAFAPLVPYSRVPLLIALGAVKDTPVVRNGQVVVGKTLQFCATFDHRLIDGVHAAKLAREVVQMFKDPEGTLGPV